VGSTLRGEDTPGQGALDQTPPTSRGEHASPQTIANEERATGGGERSPGGTAAASVVVPVAVTSISVAVAVAVAAITVGRWRWGRRGDRDWIRSLDE